jgi:predicted nucleic acid-binding protein
LKKIVSNATPIISLACVGLLSIFEELFGKIYIPRAVYMEMKLGKYPGYKDLDSNLFQVVEVINEVSPLFLSNDLGAGEAESIVVAKEMKADVLIIDERIAYKIAQNQGLNVIGTLTVLLMAKNRGLIDKIKPILDEMIAKGRWYSQRVYNHFLESIGEI